MEDIDRENMKKVEKSFTINLLLYSKHVKGQNENTLGMRMNFINEGNLY